MGAHTGGSWDITITDFEPGKSKCLAKRNPEEMPHMSDLNCHKDAALSLSPPTSLSTCVVLFLLLINTLLISLLSVFGRILYLQSWRARILSLTRGLVARIQCCYRHDATSASRWKLKPHFKLCRPRPPEINMIQLDGAFMVSNPVFLLITSGLVCDSGIHALEPVCYVASQP